MRHCEDGQGAPAPLEGGREDRVLVSVIIPTFDSCELLKDALNSLARQTLPADQIEILVIDDGSTDGTSRLLTELREPLDLKTFWQPHTGMAGTGRNTGIQHATGTYLFFHDADDYLGEDALRRLVAVADSELSDVVAGRAFRVGKRSQRSAVGDTVFDADLLEDGVWRSLSPHKLIRRALVDRLKLRFHEDMRQGEDQVFVASCLFAANRISILRDYVYYYRRWREDGQNASRQPQTLENKWLTTSRMARLIAAHSTPGRRREGLFERVMVDTLAPALFTPFMRASTAERTTFLTGIQREVLPHLTRGHLDAANERGRMRLALAQQGQAEDLVHLNDVLALPARYHNDRDLVTYDLGPELNALLSATLRRATILPLTHRILQMEPLNSGFRLTVWLAQLPTPINRVDVVARRRDGSLTVAIGAHLLTPNRMQFTIAPRHLKTAAHHQTHTSMTGDSSTGQIWDFTLRGRLDDVVVAKSRLTWKASRLPPKEVVANGQW